MPEFRTTPADHRFFGILSIIAFATVAVGFAQTYPAKFGDGATPVPGIVHVHAAVFTCWLLLFVAQTALVLRGRMALHQRLGVAGMFLAGLMLIVGGLVAVAVARLGHRGVPGVQFPDAEGFLLLNLSSIVVFSTLVAAGWLLRRRPEAHKRLMLMATVGGLMPPGISRLPLISGHAPAIGVAVLAFLLAGPLYDLVMRRRIHAAYVWGLAISMATIPPVIGAASGTQAWHRIAGWLMR
jgi:hypothetical protein